MHFLAFASQDALAGWSIYISGGQWQIIAKQDTLELCFDSLARHDGDKTADKFE